MHKIINVKFNSNSIYRIELLRVFVSYYETVIPQTEKWIFSSIRTPYLSIYNFEDLDFDLKKLKKEGREKEATYLSIETRVKGILEGLISSTKEDTMEINLRKLLSVVSSDGSYIPLKFYYKFELSRFKSQNNELK